MTIYIIILIFCLLGIIFPNRKKETNTYIYFIAALMLIIGASRDISVGSDTYGVYPYNFYYTNFNPKSWNAGTLFEPGFNYLIAGFKQYISRDYMFFITVLFIFTFIPIISFLLKYSQNKAVTLTLFYCLGFYFFAMNGMRQSLGLALCTVILHLYCFRKQKFILCSILIILAGIFFHKSLIILLLFPLIILTKKKININKKKWYIAIAVSYILAFAFQNVLLKILPILSNFVVDRYAMYMNALDETSTGITPLFKSLLAVFILYFTPKTKTNNIFLQIFLIGTILYNILVSFSSVAPRAANNILIFGCIAMANIWNNPSINNKKILVYKTGILLYAIFYIIYFYFFKNYNEIIPYSSRII